MSVSACLPAFSDSSFESAVGPSVRMVLPSARDFVPVPVGQEEPLAGDWPVMSACMQAKLMPRFLLTWAAATHRPRFLKLEQACGADSPVNDAILLDSLVFLASNWSIVLPWVAPAPLPLAPFALALAWLEPMPLPPPTPRPRVANAGAQYNA